MKNKTLIQNDPQRELLMYPNDDVTVMKVDFGACLPKSERDGLINGSHSLVGTNLLSPIVGNYFAAQVPNGEERHPSADP